MSDLNASLKAFQPEIAARYSALVTGCFERMVKDHGPTLRGAGNSWTHARTLHGLVQQFLVQTGDADAKGDKQKVIDADRLAAGAAAYAKAATEAWKDKITAKLGDLQNAHVRRMNGARFAIEGSKHGRTVCIDQEMIVNVSSKGTPFNQFPARIYVDGKFTSAAAFLKIAEQVAA